MFQIFSIIAPLFLIIFISAVLQKIFQVSNQWQKVLNSYALYIGLPILIISTLGKTSISLTEQSGLILINSIFIIGLFAATILFNKIVKFNQKLFKTAFICIGFSNIAYLGIPVLTSVLGPEILPTVSLIIAVYIFWIFTLGTGYLEHLQTKKQNLKIIITNLLKNPLILACLIGMIISALRVPIPNVVDEAMTMIINSITPIVLIVIGLFIGQSKIGHLKDWIPVAIFSIITLIVTPAILYYGIYLTGLNPINYSTTIIEAAMPLAITPFALAEKYKLDQTLISRIIVLSTIIAIITLPFWINLTT